jgi:hypothetical protein
VALVQDDSPELLARIARYSHRRPRGPVAVIDNAENYVAIQPGMVLRLGERDYYITGDAKEGRFGIDEQPKLWVKYAVDLSDGTRKIVKLAFHEQFSTRVGPFTVTCERDPDKESRVLERVAGDGRFMQGHTVYDRLGNNIRVIEQIRGSSLYNMVADIDTPHRIYFERTLPGLFDQLLDALDALAALHRMGEQHGDVRSDHLLLDADSGVLRWIDFDYRANYLDYDVWSVGSLLAYVVGRGAHGCRDAEAELRRRGEPGLEPADAQLFFPHQLVNLRKLFGYIPPALNDVLMRFSCQTTDFYDSIDEILQDLRTVRRRGW